MALPAEPDATDVHCPAAAAADADHRHAADGVLGLLLGDGVLLLVIDLGGGCLR